MPLKDTTEVTNKSLGGLKSRMEQTEKRIYEPEFYQRTKGTVQSEQGECRLKNINRALGTYGRMIMHLTPVISEVPKETRAREELRSTKRNNG